MKASTIDFGRTAFVRRMGNRTAAAALAVLLGVFAGCGGGAASNPPSAAPPPANPSTSTDLNTPGAPPQGQAVSEPVPSQVPTDQLATGWRYRFEMVSPANDNAAIRTREMNLFFKPDTSAIHFQVENRLGVAFKILWDESTFLDVNGRRFKGVHRGVTYNQRDQPQEPTWIQAGQRYADFVIPIDVLNDPSAASGTGLRTIVPTDLRAQSMIGRTFGCHLVFGSDNNAFRYEIDAMFKVVSTYRD